VVVLLEQQDVTRANRDIALGRLTPYKWLVFGISSAVLSAMVAFLVFRQLTGPETVLVGFIGLVGWPAILIGVIHLNSKKAAKSLLQGTPSLQGPTHWLFSDSAIRVDSPTGSSQIEWKTYMRVRETTVQFLLYPQTQIAHVIPKRCFSTNEQVSRFREMIRRCVPAATLQAE
jgi:YcxB-like protein